MVAAVILVLTAQGWLRGPIVGDFHVIAGLIILVREIAVSGLREFLGGIQVSVPVSQSGQMENHACKWSPWARSFWRAGCLTGTSPLTTKCSIFRTPWASGPCGAQPFLLW